MSNRIELSSPELAPAQRAAVVEELSRILADPLFKSSKRCVVLLSHLVEHALQGDHERLKERILGIEVFGRDGNYDNNADPIVRMTANEIRKRLAQYYQEQDRNQTVKIRLVRGTYYPEFDFTQSDHSHSDEAVDSGGPLGALSLPHADIPRFGRVDVSSHIAPERKWLLLVGITVLAFTAGLALHHFNFSRSAQFRLWEPLLDSNRPLMVCIADDPSMTDAGNQDYAGMISGVIASRKPPSATIPSKMNPTVTFVDASAANRITGWLASHGKRPSLVGSFGVKLHEFRQGPLVLIGGFGNAWSLILLSDLRYSIRIDPVTHEEWIEDGQDRSKREWKISVPLDADNSVDYAVITRYLDSETGNWIMAISSLGPYGERAAADLISTDALANSLPAGINSKANFQIVLKTTVLNGSINPPQVLAVHTW